MTFEAGKYYQSTLKMSATNTIGLATLALNSTYEAKNGDILTGTLTLDTENYKMPGITIADGATITLRDVNINADGSGKGQYAGLTCLGAATIILEGSNTVKGLNRDKSGIQTAEGKTLTIMGTGSLDVCCGYDDGSIGDDAGIGGKGNIDIQGGNIKATGGAHSAAIGGAESLNNTCGDITISGGTVMAICGGENNGENNAAIGGNQAGTCGNITITGGTVVARGGKYAASIGSGGSDGGSSSCGNITITGSETSVTALKGELRSSYSIGQGRNEAGGTTSCGTVTIGGVVTGSISADVYTYPTLTLNITSPDAGQIIGSDGKNYPPGSEPFGVTAVALIAYAGSDMGEAPYNHGLALAFGEKDSYCKWSEAKDYCENMAAINGAQWMLPSQEQWKAMIKALGGSEDNWEGIKDAIDNAGCIPFNANSYWTSTEKTPGSEAYYLYIVNSENYVGFGNQSETYSSYVRACFAF